MKIKKTCVLCKQEKNIDEFGFHKSYSHGRDNRCRVCFNEARRLRRKLKKQATVSGLKLPDNGLCECCGKTNNAIDKKTKKVKRLNVDHDHVTGQFRGYICEHCNIGIGRLGKQFECNDLEGVKAALKYLTRIIPK